MSCTDVTRKYSSRQLCTQLGRATLDPMFQSRITNMQPIRDFFCYKVGPPTLELNSYPMGKAMFGGGNSPPSFLEMTTLGLKN